jgi:hypothetical protein
MPVKKKKAAKKPYWSKKIILGFIGLIILLIIVIKVCPSSSKQTPSGIIGFSGTYTGNLPCADCPGIKETLTLTATNSAQNSGSYVLEDLYEERDPNPAKTTGTWEIINSNILKLTPDTASSQSQYFQVLSNGNLQMLGSNMQKIDSPFNSILSKQLKIDK